MVIVDVGRQICSVCDPDAGRSAEPLLKAADRSGDPRGSDLTRTYRVANELAGCDHRVMYNQLNAHR
jgi:hypothetical protein